MFLSGLILAALTAPAHYAVLHKYPIGGEGGWDYLTVDSDSHRLYISRGTHVSVMDTRTGKIIGDIANTQGVHGIAIASKLGKGFTSNGRDNSVSVFDLKTYKETGRIKVGQNPDAILFDKFSGRIFTFNGRSSDATAVDAATGKVLGTIPLGGKPEYPAEDGKGRLYVNVEDTNEIAEVDTKALKVLRKWSIKPGEEASGIAFDVSGHKLFSTCHNNIFAVSDTVTGKIVATPKIGNGPDAAVFDPGMKLAFSSNGQDGTLTVIKSGGDFSVVETVETQKSARTMAIDTKTHMIYLIAADFEATTGAGRPKMKANSAAILVVGPTMSK